MKKIILVSSVTFLLITACSKIQKADGVVFTADMNMENKALNFESTLKENGAHSGKYYSSVDSIMQYGAGYSYVLADSLKSKTLTVFVSAWVRESELPLEGEIAAAVETSKGNKAWVTFGLKNKSAYKVGDWVQIKDSVQYDKSILNDPHVDVRVFAIKSKGKDMLDVDDLQIKYKFSN